MTTNILFKNKEGEIFWLEKQESNSWVLLCARHCTRYVIPMNKTYASFTTIH